MNIQDLGSKVQKESYNEQEDDTDSIEIISDIEFAEDDYDSIISNLNSLIKYIDQTSIHEVWYITTIEKNKEHFVIVYKSTNHLCTYSLTSIYQNPRHLI